MILFVFLVAIKRLWLTHIVPTKIDWAERLDKVIYSLCVMLAITKKTKEDLKKY